MGRPTTKVDLLEAGNTEYQKLLALIQSMSEAEQNHEFIFEVTEKMKEEHWKRDKNLKDVLIHLYEWHQLVLNWVEANQNGETKGFLPEPYNWRTYGQMNWGFLEKHQATTLEAAKVLFEKSHKEVMSLAEAYSNEELFAKGYFSWAGTSTLGSYFVSSIPSHYGWAMKKLKKQLKALKN